MVRVVHHRVYQGSAVEGELYPDIRRSGVVKRSNLARDPAIPDASPGTGQETVLAEGYCLGESAVKRLARGQGLEVLGSGLPPSLDETSTLGDVPNKLRTMEDARADLAELLRLLGNPR